MDVHMPSWLATCTKQLAREREHIDSLNQVSVLAVTIDILFSVLAYDLVESKGRGEGENVTYSYWGI